MPMFSIGVIFFLVIFFRVLASTGRVITEKGTYLTGYIIFGAVITSMFYTFDFFPVLIFIYLIIGAILSIYIMMKEGK